MYYRELETVPGAKEEYDARNKKLAAERLKRVAALKKAKKLAKAAAK
jgi:hypothetical protein